MQLCKTPEVSGLTLNKWSKDYELHQVNWHVCFPIHDVIVAKYSSPLLVFSYFWEQRHNTRSKSNYVTNATQGNSERILSTLRDHSEITQRSFRDHSENTLRSHKERSEITQISPRDHSENSQGSLWDPSEICLNTSLKWLIDPPSNWLSWRNSSRYCHISKYQTH